KQGRTECPERFHAALRFPMACRRGHERGRTRPGSPAKSIQRRAWRRCSSALRKTISAASGGAEIDGLGALAHAVGLHVERHLLAIHERMQAGPLNGRDMDEYILRPVIGCYEAE